MIKAIDVHAHYGTYHRDHYHTLINGFMTGSATAVAERAAASGVECTIVSPMLALFPRGGADSPAGNDEAAAVVSQTSGLKQYVVINPLQPQTYEQAAVMLKQPQCVGIKIHGEEHVYPIADHGDAMFAFAAEHKAVVLAHSGDEHTMPVDFVPFADRYPEMKLILAHLGNNGPATDLDPSQQVRAIAASKHANVYTDTSSSKSIFPELIEWAVKEVGAERILFGTDTPLYFVANQRARIDYADLSEADKHAILRDNALKLFGPKLTGGGKH